MYNFMFRITKNFLMDDILFIFRDKYLTLQTFFLPKLMLHVLHKGSFIIKEFKVLSLTLNYINPRTVE